MWSGELLYCSIHQNRFADNFLHSFICPAQCKGLSVVSANNTRTIPYNNDTCSKLSLVISFASQHSFSLAAKCAIQSPMLLTFKVFSATLQHIMAADGFSASSCVVVHMDHCCTAMLIIHSPAPEHRLYSFMLSVLGVTHPCAQYTRIHVQVQLTPWR